jgi:hypothetical protein
LAWSNIDELDAAVHRAGTLVAHAASFALALDQIGIELPPVHTAQIDPAQLRAIASLYLASEMESTGLITSVEALAALTRSSAVNVDLGAANPLLVGWWQNRQQRATEDERSHSFANLFGVGASGSFEETMLTLCEALYKLDESNGKYGGMSQQMRVRTSATQLLTLLLQAAGGITVFLAQEILQSLREAIAILRHRDLLAAFGARDLWSAISRIDRLAHTSHPDARLYVQRGKAGMTVLSWLADAAPHLEQSTGVLVNLDHPVIPAALEWMQAALAIGESGTPPGANPAYSAGNNTPGNAPNQAGYGGNQPADYGSSGSGSSAPRSQWSGLAA